MEKGQLHLYPGASSFERAIGMDAIAHTLDIPATHVVGTIPAQRLGFRR